MLRVAICDDNAKELKEYTNLVNTLAKKENFTLETIEFENGEQTLFHLTNNDKPVDILLLDINMPGINGMETALKLRQPPFNYSGEIIFVTVSSDYAIEAFDVKAFHYIVKGLTPAEKTETILAEALCRANEKNKEYILFKGIGEYRNISVADIFYFEVFQRIITVHYGDKDEFEFYSSIGKLEITVLPKGFLRTHRSFIVSATQIETFNSTTLTLKNGKTLPIGRKYLPNIKLAFES